MDKKSDSIVIKIPESCIIIIKQKSGKKKKFKIIEEDDNFIDLPLKNSRPDILDPHQEGDDRNLYQFDLCDDPTADEQRKIIKKQLDDELDIMRDECCFYGNMKPIEAKSYMIITWNNENNTSLCLDNLCQNIKLSEDRIIDIKTSNVSRYIDPDLFSRKLRKCKKESPMFFNCIEFLLIRDCTKYICKLFKKGHGAIKTLVPKNITSREELEAFCLPAIKVIREEIPFLLIKRLRIFVSDPVHFPSREIRKKREYPLYLWD
jgi:hypothetical protein